MKNLILFFFSLIFVFLSSCSKVRESAGVNRKSIDEYKAIENPPLIIPPDFNLISPDKIQEKSIEDTDKELAQEILFGLDAKEKEDQKQLSTMKQILSEADVENVSQDIRIEIDEVFANQKKTEGIFQNKWKNEQEVLDAVAESERIRNKIFEGESIAEGEVPIKKEKIKVKKKKRFIFF